jgi:hypothetical protein
VLGSSCIWYGALSEPTACCCRGKPDEDDPYDLSVVVERMHKRAEVHVNAAPKVIPRNRSVCSLNFAGAALYAEVRILFDKADFRATEFQAKVRQQRGISPRRFTSPAAKALAPACCLSCYIAKFQPPQTQQAHWSKRRLWLTRAALTLQLGGFFRFFATAIFPVNMFTFIASS